MDAGTRHKMRSKFDIAYFLGKENLAFPKFESLCKLEKRHGVMLGDMYINTHGCAMFIKFIAYKLRQRLVSAINKAHFFSLQVDGSTDAANIEVELFMAICLDPYTDDGRVHVRKLLLFPCSGTGEGLYQCFCDAVKFVGLTTGNKTYRSWL